MTAVITRTQTIATHHQLMKAVRLGKAVIGNRTIMPVLATMLIEPHPDGGARATITNLETTVVYRLLGATCTEPMIVPVHALYPVLRDLPGGSKTVTASATPVSLTIDGDRVQVRGFGRQVSVEAVGKLDDFPEMGSTHGPLLARVDWQQFMTAWTFVATAAGIDNTLPMLTGVKMTFTPQVSVEMAATDRYRLTVLRVPMDRKPARAQAERLVPAKSTTRLLKMLDKGAEISIRIRRHHEIVFADRQVSIIVRCLDATFPAYRSLIPETENMTWWTVPRVALLADAKAVAAGLERGRAPLILHVGNGFIQVDGCEQHESFHPHDPEQDWRIAFNADFFIDALDSFFERGLMFGGSAPTKPWMLQGYVRKEIPQLDGQHLLMPHRLPS